MPLLIDNETRFVELIDLPTELRQYEPLLHRKLNNFKPTTPGPAFHNAARSRFMLRLVHFITDESLTELQRDCVCLLGVLVCKQRAQLPREFLTYLRARVNPSLALIRTCACLYIKDIGDCDLFLVRSCRSFLRWRAATGSDLTSAVDVVHGLADGVVATLLSLGIGASLSGRPARKFMTHESAVSLLDVVCLSPVHMPSFLLAYESMPAFRNVLLEGPQWERSVLGCLDATLRNSRSFIASNTNQVEILESIFALLLSLRDGLHVDGLLLVGAAPHALRVDSPASLSVLSWMLEERPFETVRQLRASPLPATGRDDLRQCVLAQIDEAMIACGFKSACVSPFHASIVIVQTC